MSAPLKQLEGPELASVTQKVDRTTQWEIGLVNRIQSVELGLLFKVAILLGRLVTVLFALLQG